MTPAQLDEIEAREKAATPGPWTPKQLPDDSDGHARNWTVDGPKFFEVDYGPVHEWQPRNDMGFIAHAREDIPALLAEVRRLRGLLLEHYNFYPLADHAKDDNPKYHALISETEKTLGLDPDAWMQGLVKGR